MPRGPAGAQLARLRTVLTVFFALDGFVFAGWVVRIPDIKDQTGASPSALGLALLGVSAGGVATMVLTGGLIRRYGAHAVTVGTAALLSAGVVLPPLTRSALALGLVLVVFGAAFGSISVAMNSAAVDLVAALRRPVMPSFHAAFSLGGMLGAGLGALVAGHLSPTRHLLLLALLGLAVTAFAGPALLALPAPERPPAPEDADRADVPDPSGSDAAADSGPAAAERPAGRTRLLVAVLGLVALCTAYGEGAMADWSALHLKESLDAGPGLAAAGYSVFALAMTAGRLSGTALLLRLGQNRALVAGGATACVGMLLGSFSPYVWGALAGFALTGLGLANIFPIAIGRAGELAGPNGVAAASTLGYGGMLLGPPAIGFLADWFSLRAALSTVALLAGAAALIAYAMQAVQNGGRPRGT
ncbi:MFS transporter [Streptomyces sp. WAC 06738]|uniref:MFS transporter n=1 Tax=Streptomyces sp. WAC 06738 TaxID=2203210 RepID=UPI000F6E3284|nr:MFS transporter [Streptomyces sp. WAC 06738]AZM44724.1 MFS transporter [Streptomyces sp. WAC 06738]